MRYIAKFLWPLSGKGKRGHAESRRVLAHLIKDKDLDPEKPRSNSPQWLKIASAAAMYANERPDIWEFGPSMDPRTFDLQEPQIIGVHDNLHQYHKVLGILMPLLRARAMEKGKIYGKGQGTYHHGHQVIEILQSL